MNIYRNHKKIFKICLLLLGFVLIFSVGINNTVAATTPSIYVSTNGNDSWDGLNSTYIGDKSGPKATIKNATSTLNSGGTVYIDSGTYKENNITINTDMSIIGKNQETTIIDGSTNNIFNIQSGVQVTISNLTILNGSFTNGGAIYNQGKLTLNDDNFINNSAVFGGSVYNENSGTLTVTSNNFVNDTATDFGGAIYNSGTSKVIDCNFTNNMAGMGGAIYNYNILIASGNNFTDNTACDGGAVVNEDVLGLSNSNFSNNNAMCAGGAIINFNACTLTVTNSTFIYNTATFGGVVVNYGIVNLADNNLSNNKASQYGGFIFNYSTAEIHFNRIIGNTAIAGNAIYNSNGNLDASLNWWGSNAGPPIGDVSGITIPLWLVLTVTANPQTIPSNTLSTITADLLHDSNGNFHDHVYGYIQDIPVNFISTGIMNTLSTINGRAQFNLNGGLNTGVDTVSTTIDNQTVKTLVIIDTIPPKVTLTSPKKNAKRFSRTSRIAIKFSEKIKTSLNWSKITVINKNGKAVKITKSISGTTIFIKTTTKRKSNSWYTIKIPRSAIKDFVGNNLLVNYTFKFKIR